MRLYDYTPARALLSKEDTAGGTAAGGQHERRTRLVGDTIILRITEVYGKGLIRFEGMPSRRTVFFCGRTIEKKPIY